MPNKDKLRLNKQDVIPSDFQYLISFIQFFFENNKE